MTIVTLQQTYRAGRSVMRMFCGDAVHIAAMERGEIICGHCGKPLFRPGLPKCQHGVYRPASDSRTCSLCNGCANCEPAKGEINRNYSGRYRYTRVRIDAADQTLLGMPGKDDQTDEPQFDHHQFERHQAPEAEALSQLFGEDQGDAKSLAVFVGLIRNGGKLVQARVDAPQWILNSGTLQEFTSTQKNAERAEDVLFLFYRCSATDAQIATELGVSEDAAKKYRQRLLLEGNLRFGADLKAA